MISKNQVSHVKSLHLKKYREQEKLFIAEGKKIVEELVKTYPELISELFATEEFITANKKIIESNKIKFTLIKETELERISNLTTPNQVLAVCNYFEETSIDLALQNFTLYLDDIRDPGNLGTILRTADWFGMKQIFCSPNSTDIYNSKTIQSAMGAFLRVKVNYIDLMELLKGSDIPVYGAVLNGKDLYSEKVKKGIIVIGNEANGISQNNLSLITHPITIPAASSNKTESLNAAVAASVISAEFFRQITH